MRSVRTPLTVLLFLFGLCVHAKEVTDTLYSNKNDRIIVTYSITQKGNRVELQFTNVRKDLGNLHRSKYSKETDQVHILFFDWIGVRDNMKFLGETPSPIAFPAKANYKKSRDGYFIVEQRPAFSFEMEANGATSFTVPLYLAHYEGKQTYKILCSCGDLKITLPSAPTLTSNTGSGSKTQAKPTENEPETDDEEDAKINEKANNMINSIMSELPKQDTLPMKANIKREYDNLVDLKSSVKDKGILSSINATIDAYNEKEKELQNKISKAQKQKADDDAFAGCSTKENFEQYARQFPNGKHVDEAKAKISVLEEKEKQEAKDKQKRNIWMIIGGVLLAILLFVGNQVLQGVRNRRNQRNMMQMQKEATNRAQSMARSKIQGEVRKQTNKAVGKARKEGQSLISGAGKNIKGNNRVSI